MFSIAVLDSSKAQTAILTEVASASVTEELNGQDSLTLRIADTDKWSHLTGDKAYLRVTNLDDATYKTYLVQSHRQVKARDGSLHLEVQAEGIKIEMGTEIYPYSKSFKDIPLGSLLTEIFGHSSFTKGTVYNDTEEIDYVEFNHENILYCIEKITEKLDRDVFIDETASPIEVDFLEPEATDSGVLLHYRKNIKSIVRGVDHTGIVNRVYGIGGGDPPLDLTGAAKSGGKAYIDNEASIASYGTRKGTYQNTGLEDVDNLVTTPALSGAYAAGLCEDWTKEGSPTLSENTNSDYILYGTKAQKIIATSDGDGISQTVTLPPEKAYSMAVNIYVEQGSVKVECTDGPTVYANKDGTSGTGWLTVEIEDFWVIATTLDISITQQGSTAATFYVDSVQVTEGAQNGDFVIGNSADLLFDETVEFLKRSSDPVYSYEVDLLDLYKTDSTRWEYEQFEVGESVRIRDEDLDLNLLARVMSRRWDVTNPQDCLMGLSTRLRSIADHIVQQRRLAHDLAENQRAISRRSMTVGGIFARQVGFNALSFTSDVSFYSVSYDGFGWSSGTLRVGGTKYSISAGSQSGLDASSTYFLYFDRLLPTTFGITKYETEAHTPDRLFVATIFTQSSDDEGCAIFPVVGEGTYLGKHVVAGQIDSYNWGPDSGSRFDLNAGTFYLGGSDSPKLSWDGTTLAIDGTITATIGVIGGFTVDGTEGLYAGAAATRVQMKAGAGFWAGATAFGDAPFRVSEAGALTATSATITGTITATTGVIGGFTVSAAEGLYAGAAATRVQMKAGAGFWAGATAFGAAPFRVNQAGALVAASATITGAITISSGSGIANLSDAGVLAVGDDADDVPESGTKKWAGETGADITGDHSAATIAGQGALATQASVDLATGEVTNKTADNIAETIAKKWAGETGADITVDHEAATITGQGDLATEDTVGAADCDVTIIDGGKIITGLLTATNIQAGTLTGRTVQSAVAGSYVKLDAANHRIDLKHTDAASISTIQAYDVGGLELDTNAAGLTYIRFQNSGAGDLEVDVLGILNVSSAIQAAGDASVDFGTGIVRFKDLYLSGDLDDGTVSLTVANAKTAFDASHAQAHTVVSHSDTTGTGAELNELTGGGDTVLHDHDGIAENTAARHAEAHAVDSTGPHAEAGLTIGHVLRASAAAAFDFAQLEHADLGGVAANQHHAQAHTVVSHSDTTGTGAELNELTGGGDTVLHDHDGIAENTAARHTESHALSAVAHTGDLLFIQLDDIVDIVGVGANNMLSRADHVHTAADGSSKITHANVLAPGADDHHAEAHTVASHSDTTGTGAELDELTGGGDTVLHDHDGIAENTAARHARSHDHSNAGDGDRLNPDELNFPTAAPAVPVLGDAWITDNGPAGIVLSIQSAVTGVKTVTLT